MSDTAKNLYPTLSMNQAIALITANALAQNPTPVFMIGAPGIGKTARVLGEVTQALNAAKGGATPYYTPVSFEVGHGAPEDTAGIPVRNATTGQVERLPLGPMYLASTRPCVFFLDEISRANQTLQGVILTILQERRAGDFRLHPDTVIVLAANGTSSAGAHGLIDALVNRCCMIYVQATNKEVGDYLMTSVGAEGTTAKDLAVDYAFSADRAPKLIQCDPPPNSAEGAQWASPRQIVKGILNFAALLDTPPPPDMEERAWDHVCTAALEGCIGPEAAGAWLALRRIREKLPSKSEIVANPKTAKLPAESDGQANVAILGLIGMVAVEAPDAAWVYANRVANKEVMMALTARLKNLAAACSPEGRQARQSMLGRVGMVQIAAMNQKRG